MEKPPETTFAEGDSVLSLNGLTLPHIDDTSVMSPSSSGHHNSAGVRRSPLSPSQKSPQCSKGKSMKEMESDLDSFRRENFDLKMRIYIMEEQMELFENKESLLQKHEELKVLQAENEKLLNEVKEKSELVLKAGEAVSLLNQKHSEEVRVLAEGYEKQIQELKDKVTELQESLASKDKANILSTIESALEESKLEDSLQIPMGDSYMSCQTHSVLLTDLELQVQELQLQLENNNRCVLEYVEQVKYLKEELDEARLVSKTLEEKVKDKTNSLERVFSELREKEKLIVGMSKQTHALKEALELRELRIDSLTKKLEDINDAGTNLKAVALREADSNRVDDGWLAMEASSSSSASSSVAFKEIDKLHEDLANKENELERVRTDHLKTLQAMQGLVSVNKALTADNELLRSRIDSLKAQQKLPMHGQSVNEERALLVEASCTESGQNVTDDLDTTVRVEEDNHIEKMTQLEAEVSHLKSQLAAVTAAKNQFENDVEIKVKEIDHLNEELKKRTTNLQGLVNTELWDKNKEIEKLNSACEKKQAEVVNLRRKLADQRQELSALNSKVQELSDLVRVDVSELKNQLDEAYRTKNELESECTKWRTEAEKSEKIQKELVNACVLLKTRLEELASFLDSLLRVPWLGAKRRQQLQKAIDRSREVSQRLSLPGLDEAGVDTSIPILPDLSQVDFFSEDDLTALESKNSPDASNAEVSSLHHSTSLVADKLTCLAHLSKDLNLEDVTEGSLPVSFSDSASCPASRQQSSQWRPIPPQQTSPPKPSLCSETEEWSEPDRNVSLARIGLTDVSVVCPPTTDESTDRSCSRSISSCSRKGQKSDGKRRLTRTKSVERKSASRSPDKLILADNLQATGDFISSCAALKNQEMQGDKPPDLESSLKINREILKRISESFDDGDLNKKELLLLLHTIAAQLEKLCSLCTYLEGRCGALEKEKEDLSVKLNQREDRIDLLTKDMATLQTELKEKENEALEKHCMLLEIKLDREAKNMEKTIEDLDNRLKNSEEQLKKSKQREEELVSENVKLDLMVKERQKAIVELQNTLEKAFMKIQDLSKSRMLLDSEWKQKLDCLTKEKNDEIDSEVLKRKELERKLVDCYEAQAQLQKALDIEMTKTRDIEVTKKTSERWWRRRAEELETSSAEREAELRRRLDAAALATSQAILERTRLANDKIRLQCEIRRRDETAHEVQTELEQRVKELEEANGDMKKKNSLCYLHHQHHCSQFPNVPPSLSDPETTTSAVNRHFGRQRSNPTSDYTSDPDQHGSNGNVWFPAFGRNNNCSPDLGIESDQGKMSSLDPIPSPKSLGVLGQLEKENADLRNQLNRVRMQLKVTSRQLDEASRRNRQCEKAISLEVTKTRHILQKARMNISPDPDNNELPRSAR